MSDGLAVKILKKHIVRGEPITGTEIGVCIDQTLTQDATGTLAYLQFEAMKIPRVKTKLSVSYVDHNTLQEGFENFDDHLFLQTFAKKYGIYFSKPGSGICHQIHLERFGVPGETLLGSDSHTSTGGGMGMLAIGAGGLDVALAMAGEPFYMTMPEIIKVTLKGKLRPYVAAKDVILELLRRLTVRGGVGKIFEYAGEGVKTLSVPERATITNMGAELGATTSVFPSDKTTREFLKWQGRQKQWVESIADKDAKYDGEIVIDLSKLVPMTAQPHSPDNVARVKDLKGVKINQAIIGSCTNSSYKDLMTVAFILKGRRINPEVSFAVAPGSAQVMKMLARNGALDTIIKAGARILETSCGPCIGMGQAPNSKGVSVRTFNRNFKGRSGTADASLYLASPEVAVWSAVKGYLSDPMEIKRKPRVPAANPDMEDTLIIAPSKDKDTGRLEVKRGPNIKPLPAMSLAPEILTGEVLLKVTDNITTDDIMPAGAKILPLRSNIPAISEYVYAKIDKDFSKRAKEKAGGIIVGGFNYGQGSSREHAALAPRYLGVKAVLAKSFARIHAANLINFGILPLVFENEKDYGCLEQGDLLEIKDFKSQLETGVFYIANKTKGTALKARATLNRRQKNIILAGSLLGLAGKSSN
ncbi:MAG: aconitate hydratase [Candidatus Firestonebacteria bacterium]